MYKTVTLLGLLNIYYLFCQYHQVFDNIDIEIEIVYNFKDFFDIFENIYSILIGIGVYYVFLNILSKIFDHFYKNFKKSNPNLIETKTNYFLSYHLFNTLVKSHDFSTAILLFISLVQFKFLNKKVNLINYILLNLYSLLNSFIDWSRDYKTHTKNNKKYKKNGENTYSKARSINLGDIICLERNDEVCVKEGIVQKNNIVVFNLGQTGERTIEEIKVGEKITDGLIVKNHNPVYIKVTKTNKDINENGDIQNIQNIQNIHETNKKMTIFGIIIIFLFSFYIEIYKTNNNINNINNNDNNNTYNIYFSHILLDVIGCFIGLNYLIPSFKIAQSLNLWDSVYQYITVKYHHFRVCNHGDESVIYLPEDSVILSDKTGTLTNNVLTIEKNFIDEDHIDLILSHINSYLDDDSNHTSHSPETNIIADYICKKYGIKQDNVYKWVEEKCILYNKIMRLKKYTYKDTNFGSHSLVYKDNTYYHVFMGSKYLISKKIGYIGNEKVSSLKRGMIIGFVKVFEDNLEKAVENFREDKINNYQIIGEFHFNNYYRESNIQHTKNGIEKLKRVGYPFYVITGDSILTAKDIGIELGIIREEDNVIDGNQFMKKEDFEKEIIIENLIQKGCGIFGNTRAMYKEKIVDHFKLKSKKVIFLGDQENDYLALKKSNFSVVQENGNMRCKNIANLIGNIPTETVYNYLQKYRSIGINGKWWFYTKMYMFNYFTAGIWLMGIIYKDLSKTSIIFNDPWDPRNSLIMSITITLYVLYRSFVINNYKNKNNNIESLKSLLFSLIIGKFIYITDNISIILITVFMFFNGLF